MKEDKKKKTTTSKKTDTKKTSTNKKSSGVKKTTPARKTTTKTVAAKVPTKKKAVAKKTTVKKDVKVETQKEEKIVVEKKETTKVNQDLLLRTFLVISYTLIFVILILGFIETYTRDLKVEPNFKPVYFEEKNVLKKENMLKLESTKSVLNSLSGDYFVYVGYTKMYNNEMYNLDMGIASLIKKYGLKDNFYYINIDSIINEKNKEDIVNKYLGFDNLKITKVPTIIYINSDNIARPENIIARDDNQLMNVGDFQQLLDINQFVEKK